MKALNSSLNYEFVSIMQLSLCNFFGEEDYEAAKLLVSEFVFFIWNASIIATPNDNASRVCRNSVFFSKESQFKIPILESSYSPASPF